ncbi:MAG: nitroreductase family protein [Pseudomonadota bacterium]|nr:nitroreductase family protein [Pseudomonadota bacterium]
MGVKKETKLGANDIWEVMFTQRAIRYWVEEPVSRELIERVIEAASKAPSGSNHQPWMFVVADRDPVKTSLAEALRDYYEEGPLKTLVESSQKTEDSSQRLMMSGAENFFTNLRTAPAIIIPCLYKLSSPTSEMNTLIAGSSIYLAVQNMLLAARALGLGTLMTTSHSLIEEVIRDVCKIPDDAQPAALIPIGFPAVKFGPTKRKPVRDIIAWNQWK